MNNYDDILSDLDFDTDYNHHHQITHDGDYQDPDESFENREYTGLGYGYVEDARAEEDLLKGLDSDTAESTEKGTTTSNVFTNMDNVDDKSYTGENAMDDDDDDDDEEEIEGGDKDLNPLLWSFTVKDLTGDPSDVLDRNIALQEVIRSEIIKLRERINHNIKIQQNLVKVLKQGNKAKFTGRHRGFSFFPSFYKDVNKNHPYFYIYTQFHLTNLHNKGTG